MPTTAVRRLISLFSRSSGFVLRSCRRWASGNVKCDEQVGLRVGEQLGHRRETRG